MLGSGLHRCIFPAITTARTRSLRPYVGLVALGAFTLAIGLGLELRRHLHFAYHANSGIVGWVQVHRYPKQQELLYFLLALIGPPFVMTLYWLAWIAYGTIAARWTSQPIERLLRQGAVASLPLLLIWRDIYRLDNSWVTRLGLPIGLTVAAVIGSCSLTRRRAPVAHASVAPAVSAQPETISPHGHASRLRSLLLMGLKYLVLPVVIYLKVYSGHIQGHIDLFHEGELLAPLNELLRGGVPFRDVYLQHGLFQDAYLGLLASAVFSPTLDGVRSIERLLDPLGYVALYLLGLQVFRGGSMTSLTLVLIASGAYISVFARHAPGLISLAVVANYVTRQQRSAGFADGKRWMKEEDRGSWHLIGAGVTTSAAFWYSAEVGLYTLAAIGIFLLLYGFSVPGRSFRRGLPPLVGYGSGLLIGFGSVGAYLWLHGALDAAIANTYIQCAYQLDTWGRAFPALSSILRPLADSGTAAGWRPFVLSEGFRWYLPVFVFMMAGGYLTYRWLCGGLWQSEGCVKLLLLLLVGAVFFRTALGRSDRTHMVYSATCAWILLLFFVDRGVARLVDHCRLLNIAWKPRVVRALTSAWIIVPTLALLWYAREVHYPRTVRGGERESRRSSLLDGHLFEQAVHPTSLERAGKIDIPEDQEEQIRGVVAYIRQQTAADEAIFDFSNQGAFYFFADRPSVTRFPQVVFASTPDLQQEVIDALERQQTRFVIFKTGGWADHFDGIPNEKRHPLIARYLAEHYEPAVNIKGTELLKRRR